MHAQIRKKLSVGVLRFVLAINVLHREKGREANGQTGSNCSTRWPVPGISKEILFVKDVTPTPASPA